MILRPFKRHEGNETTGYFIWCLGCEMRHAIWIAVADVKKPNPVWKFNGDEKQPTFEPSLLVMLEEKPNKRVCHSFIRNGKIEFLSDCWHKFAAQTIPLPHFRKDKW